MMFLTGQEGWCKHKAWPQVRARTGHSPTVKGEGVLPGCTEAIRWGEGAVVGADGSSLLVS